MEQTGEKAKIVCEFGIGTNKTTKLIPEVLEAEKVYGTGHLAFGNNATFGGKKFGSVSFRWHNKKSQRLLSIIKL